MTVLRLDDPPDAHLQPQFVIRQRDFITPAPMTSGVTRGRPRPAWLRARGLAGPPARVTLAKDRSVWERRDTYKTDTWAATGLYACGARFMVCKFHRAQPLLGLPTTWLGRWVARREATALRMLADVEGIPRDLGPVEVEGRVDPTVLAREFMDGMPLPRGYRPDDDFFPRLTAMLDVLHDRGMAYADLTKRDNIIVTPSGRPCLIDFQIHVRFPQHGFAAWVTGPLRRSMFRTDRFHLHKHVARHRRDLLTEEQATLERQRPWLNRWWRRLVTRPFQGLRRGLLVRLGVRRPGGDARTEHEPMHALRDTEPD